VIDLAFYNAGCGGLKGPKKAIIPFRRALRRVLRPIFQRQVDILQHLCDRLDGDDREIRGLRTDLDHLTRRHEHAASQIQATMAFGWDYVAMARRLAILEDRVEALMARAERAAGDPDGALAEPRARVA
jgi:hypothetical protein